MNKLAISAVAFVLFAGASLANAQDCSIPTTQISTQSQIDNFEPACSNVTITGTLTIWSSPRGSIRNLDGLSKLTGVSGYVLLRNNNALTDISGLGNISTIGGHFQVRNNDALPNLDGLNLDRINGYLRVRNNAILADLDGLSSLSMIGNHLRFDNNPSLSSLAGLANITSLRSYLRINNNDALTHLDGLSGLTSIGGYVNIINNDDLASVEGLAGLTQVDNYFRIRNNDSLTSLDGLESLISVQNAVQIDGNAALTSCSAVIPLIDTYDDGAPGPGPNAGPPTGVSVLAHDVGGLANLEDNGGGECDTAAAALSSSVAPTFTQAFSPATVKIGETSTLTFTIDNAASRIRTTELAFTNDLPAGLSIASPANAATTCTGGTLTAVEAATTISYTGGLVDTAAQCTVSVDVVPDSTGDFNNTSGDLSYTLGDSGNSSATLTVEELNRSFTSAPAWRRYGHPQFYFQRPILQL